MGWFKRLKEFFTRLIPRCKIRRHILVLFCLQASLIWIADFHKKTSDRSIVFWLPAPRTQFVCEGNLFKPIERKEEWETLWVDLDFCKKPGEAYFSAVSGRVGLRTLLRFNDDLMEGDVVRFQSSLKLPRDFKNPGSFSSTGYYQSIGVEALGFISDPAWVVRLQNNRHALFQKGFEKIRRQVRHAVAAATAPPTSHFLLGLLTGERKELGKTWEENFRKAGGSHILSISGLHVTMAALFF